MNRKDTLRALLSAREKLPDGNTVETADIADAANQPTAGRSHVRSGAVGALGKSLDRMAAVAEQAKALVDSGATIVEINPEQIDRSFITDRLGSDERDQRSLSASISEHGQQVPILVRPHPSAIGRYQVAYGHRRLQAAIDLARPVKAIIRPLTDSELVVAQGQENSARLDLSYIEKAKFAVEIEDRGFDRAVLMAALGLEKTQLSRLIAIGRAVPGSLLLVIGAAPKTGRPRWAALAEMLPKMDWEATMQKLQKETGFASFDSDARFARFFSLLRMRSKTPDQEIWKDETGKATILIKKAKNQMVLTVDEKHNPEFGRFIVSQLDKLYPHYLASRLPARE